MTRITMLTPDQLDPELRRLSRADDRTPLELGLTRIFGHQPEMAKGLSEFAASLKENRTLPPRMIELVRLRVAFHNQCRSCMAIRYPDALADGLTEDLVCSLEKPMEADDLNEAEKHRHPLRRAVRHQPPRHRRRLLRPAARALHRAGDRRARPQRALFVGVGRLSATWDMIEELPDRFQEAGRGRPVGCATPSSSVKRIAMDDCWGKVAVVTGGASGIGWPWPSASAEGMKVVIADIEARAPWRRRRAPRRPQVPMASDRRHGRGPSVEALADAAYDRFGAVHVVCNNAGVVTRGAAWKQSLEDWNWVLGVDLWGVIHGVQGLRAAHARRRRAGPPREHGVDRRPARLPSIAPYNVAKVGVVALSETRSTTCGRGRADRRVGAVPGRRADPHRRERPEPPRRPAWRHPPDAGRDTGAAAGDGPPARRWRSS